MLNNIVLLHKIQINYCRIPESPYICTVFFIVLDLRLTKVGARRCSFFYAYTLPIRTAILKTHRVFGLPWILFSITDLHKYNMNF